MFFYHLHLNLVNTFCPYGKKKKERKITPILEKKILIIFTNIFFQY